MQQKAGQDGVPSAWQQRNSKVHGRPLMSTDMQGASKPTPTGIPKAAEADSTVTGQADGAAEVLDCCGLRVSAVFDGSVSVKELSRALCSSFGRSAPLSELLFSTEASVNKVRLPLLEFRQKGFLCRGIFSPMLILGHLSLRRLVLS